MTGIKKLGKSGIITGVCLAAAVIVFLALYLLLPSRYLSIDVNPSIELKLNRLNQVVEIKAANEDAQALLEGYKAKSHRADAVVKDFADLLMKQGYLGENKPNDILITMEKGGSTKELEGLCAQVTEIMDSHKMLANVTGQVVELSSETVKAAEENGMSAGKMSVIERLLAADASLKAEELLQISVGDLLSYATTAGIPMDVIEDHLDAAEDVLGDSPEIDALEDGIDDDAAEDAADAAEDAADAAADAADDAADAAEEAADAEEEAREQAEDDAEEAADAARDKAEQERDAAKDADESGDTAEDTDASDD